MKLWHSLTTCLIVLLLLLGSVRGSRLLQRLSARSAVGTSGARAVEGSPVEMPEERVRPSVNSPGSSLSRRDRSAGRGRSMEAEKRKQQLDVGGQNSMDYENVVDFIKVTISRIHHSPPSDAGTRTRHKRAKKRGQQSHSRRGAAGKRGSGGQGRGHGCVLKQVQLNITDLGLGYRSGEEMIFRYCAGPCRKSETNYDKILFSLTQSKRVLLKDRPAQVCCRPVAFDDDLSFLDDNLVYHTVRKHSARKCACV